MSPTCVSRVPIFAGLSPLEQDEVHEVARPRRVHDGELGYSEGDPSAHLLVVNTGRLRLTRPNRDGAEQLLRVLDARSFVGVESFPTEAHPGHISAAMRETWLCE